MAILTDDFIFITLQQKHETHTEVYHTNSLRDIGQM